MALSLLVCFFLVWLIYIREGGGDYQSWVDSLPLLNAVMNGLCAISLCAGWWSIKKEKREIHRKFMLSAVFFSALFLISYVTYHYFHGDTPFLSQGFVRPMYFFILVSHICFSVIALPMVLTTLYYALNESFDNHLKVARYTCPIWLYVSVTGVLVFGLLKFYG